MTQHPADHSTTDCVLVLGADGTVARAALDSLLSRGARIRALVRRHRPGRDSRVEWVVGDLRDDSVLRDALVGIRTVLYVTPHADEEVSMAHLVVGECRRAGARLVFVGVHVSGRTLRGRLTRQLFRLMLPAYGPKLDLAAMVETTSPDVVMLVPTNFYDNDLQFLPEIVAGTFPTPLRGVNRVAVCDIGDIAAAALTDPAFPAGAHGICGPATLTGAESAEVWTEVLGRPVRYAGTDKLAWEATLRRSIPDGKKQRDWRNSFRALGWMTMGTSAREVTQTARLLGRPPTTYRDWVQGHADPLGAQDGRKAMASGR